MTDRELQNLLDELLSLPAENEVVEFKEARNNFDFGELGKYFSALSNEANLKGRPDGWLVFGVNNQRQVVGSNYRKDRPALDRLIKELADKINNRLSFRDIHEVYRDGKRVLLFQIPPALGGTPTSWEGHCYGRDGESLGPLNPDERHRIETQATRQDWSAEIVTAASLADLDPQGLLKAREQYKVKNPRLAAEVDQWTDAAFLTRLKLLVGGHLTKAALLLLGRDEASVHLTPADATITWVLQDAQKMPKDYAHFGPPWLLQVDEVLAKVRNLKYRYFRDTTTLFPDEVDQYDVVVLREALHNCIAHQNYRLGGRISVVEREDGQIIFENVGTFLPERVEDVVLSDTPHPIRRNARLADAMVQLNMIDTISFGIKRMFDSQRRKGFPLPEYHLDGKVRLEIIGKVIDQEFARLLDRDPSLSLHEVILLDKVQKQKLLTDAEAQLLRKKKLIEGRKPHFIIAARVAQLTGQTVAYTKQKGFDEQYYADLVQLYLQQHGSASRAEIDSLLMDKLPDLLDQKQKLSKINMLLTRKMRKGKNCIEHVKMDGRWVWRLCP